MLCYPGSQLACRLLCLAHSELGWVQDKGKQTVYACSAHLQAALSHTR